MVIRTDIRTLDALAGRLRSAYDSSEPIAPIRTELPEGDVTAAYGIQQINTEFWVGQGRRIVGHKIGLTSPAVQSQLGVHQPDFGVLFADMRVPDGGSLPPGAVLQPRAEAEVALVLARPIEDPKTEVADLAAAVGYVVPAIEICGSRIAGWDIGIVDTIADNASCGLFVLGENPVEPAGVDLAAVTMCMSIDGRVVSEGVGAACLGHPYHSALWLARRLIAEGSPLQKGEIIMSGALGPMCDLPVGATVTARIAGLGSLSVRQGAAP